MQKDRLPTRCIIAVLALLMSTIFLNCATTSRPDLATEQLAAKGVDEAALRRGRALAMTECTECHRYYWPHEYSVEQWPGIVKKMGKRASLTSSQIEDVEFYFVTMRGAIQLNDR